MQNSRIGTNGGRARRLWSLLCALLLLAPVLACIKHPPRNLPSAEEQLSANVAECDPDGLAFEVVDFTWSYYKDKAMIKIMGTARNDSGQPQQAVSLIAQAFDEKGRPVLTGRSFLDPTYLAPGAAGKFEYLALITDNLTDIKHIRLVTTATTLR